MIEIVAYNSKWPLKFERMAGEIKITLGDLALRIDHIGSTAVPGLHSKDKIDIQVTVAELSDVVLAAFVRDQYTYYPDLSDHRPPGDASPDDQWKKMVLSFPDDKESANIHVRVNGHANWHYALLFRDYLRTHPIARHSYGLMKQELARLHPNDKVSYYAVKEPVFDIIWEAALAWEKESNWKVGQ